MAALVPVAVGPLFRSSTDGCFGFSSRQCRLPVRLVGRVRRFGRFRIALRNGEGTQDLPRAWTAGRSGLPGRAPDRGGVEEGGRVGVGGHGELEREVG